LHSAPAGPADHTCVVASTHWQAALATMKCRWRHALSHDARECNQALASEQKRGLAGSTNMFGTPATRRAHTSEPTVGEAVRCEIDLLPCACIEEEACKRAPDSSIPYITLSNYESENATRTTLAEHKHAPLMQKHELLFAAVNCAACRRDRAVFSGQATHAV
jgi:hypothetical protein